MSIDVACYGIVSRDPEEKTSASGRSYLRLSIRAGSANSVTWLTVMVFADVEDLAGRLATEFQGLHRRHFGCRCLDRQGRQSTAEPDGHVLALRRDPSNRPRQASARARVKAKTSQPVGQPE